MSKRTAFGILAFVAAATLPHAPAFADIPDADTYAEQQCGNGGAQAKGYPEYESCYADALIYYEYQVYGTGPWGGGGGDGGGGGGGGGGTSIVDLPSYPHGCASRLCGDQSGD